MKKKNKEQESKALDALVQDDENTAQEKPEDENDLEKGEETSENTADKSEMIKKDVALLKELFPDLSIDDIPEDVWKEVEKGQSLAGSYALHFIKKIKEEAKIRFINEQNSKKAPPKVLNDNEEKNYFSPEAVKKMSRADVRKEQLHPLNLFVFLSK